MEKSPKNVLIGCPLHAEEHNLLLFTDASVKGWGAHLGDMTVSGMWSNRGKFAYKHSAIESSVFGNKVLSNPSNEQRVLVASDNATVVSYLNKQGGPTP